MGIGTEHRPGEVPHRLLIAVVALAAAVAGCAGNDRETGGGGDGAPVVTTDPSTRPSSTTANDAGTGTGDASTTDVDAQLTMTCENPEGFTISYPAGWATNEGSVVAACSMFDPRPSEVEEGTDARFADVAVFVDDVPFAEAAAPGREDDRAVTAISGHQAVRLGGESMGEGIYPSGTPYVRYLVDLSLGVDDGPGTLFVDVVDIGDVDYRDSVRTLDRMMATMELTIDAEAAPAGTVARYEGGGTPFTVVVDEGHEGVCLRLTASETATCAAPVTAGSIETVDLGDGPGPVLAGTAAGNVFRVDALVAGGRYSFLPVGIDGSDAAGWALPLDRTDVDELVWYDIEGNQLGRATIDGTDDGGIDPVGTFTGEPTASPGFPASGDRNILTAVRAAGQDGFDRVVFELDGSSELSWRAGFVDELVGASGRPIEVAGRSILQISMAPAGRSGPPGGSVTAGYDGPERLEPVGTALVAEVVLGEDFEAQLTWGVGVPSGTRYAVAVLPDPQRLVIDISAAGGERAADR